MMVSKVIETSTLVLRIITLLCTTACILVLVTDNFILLDGQNLSFKELDTYKYVLASAAIGAAYTLFQLPFALYLVSTGKRLIGKNLLPTFDFYGDKLMSFLLASGVGSGFAVTYEFKSILDELFDLFEVVAPGSKASEPDFETFLNRGYIAVGVLGGGFICMALLSILSSFNYNKSKSLL